MRNFRDFKEYIKDRQEYRKERQYIRGQLSDDNRNFW